MIASEGEGVDGDITDAEMVDATVTVSSVRLEGVTGGVKGFGGGDITEAVVDIGEDDIDSGGRQHEGNFFPFLLALEYEAGEKKNW